MTCFLIVNEGNGVTSTSTGNQEYSARTLGATWGIISAVMLPFVVVLICVGWRFLLRKKREEQEGEADEFMSIKTRPLDPDESIKVNSDEESIPYKKDIDDSPVPSDAVQVADSAGDNAGYTYDAQRNEPYGQPSQSRQWTGETEIN